MLRFLKSGYKPHLALGTVCLYPIYHGYNEYNEYKRNEEQDKPLKPLKYSLEEVKKHNKENDIWVHDNNNVYDITKFIEHHPGGKEKILLAAGDSIIPHWNIYKQHYDKNVQSILDEYYIGDLIIDTENIVKIKETLKEPLKDNPYKDEPKRNEELKILKQEPFNAQPDLKKLRENYITPQENWYIRNHHPVPQINKKDYKLKITTPISSKEYSLDELKKLKKNVIINTIQCAGNRRKDYQELEKVMGLNWNGAAISTGKFGGVFLWDLIKDISKYYSIDFYNLDEDYHIQFMGYDEPFDGSVHLNQNINLLKDTLLAYEINDEELSLDHGYPLRVVVPGYTGAKNIKWLKEIIISKDESKSSWQKGVAYKSFGPSVKNFESITEKDKKETPTVEKLPVQSFICDINIQKEDDDRFILVEGIAYSGGGNNIIRVDVSIDDGETFHVAELKEGNKQPKYKAYAWTFWSIKIPIKNNENNENNENKFTVVCKATDINYNTQPENIKDIWNLRGILNNSLHRVNYKSLF